MFNSQAFNQQCGQSAVEVGLAKNIRGRLGCKLSQMLPKAIQAEGRCGRHQRGDVLFFAAHLGMCCATARLSHPTFLPPPDDSSALAERGRSQWQSSQLINDGAACGKKRCRLRCRKQWQRAKPTAATDNLKPFAAPHKNAPTQGNGRRECCVLRHSLTFVKPVWHRRVGGSQKTPGSTVCLRWVGKGGQVMQYGAIASRS